MFHKDCFYNIPSAQRYGAYAGIGVGVTTGAIVLAPVVIGAYLSPTSFSVSSVPHPDPGLGIPTLAIGLPIYGAYKLAK